jgi:hypothetical protein
VSPAERREPAAHSAAKSIVQTELDDLDPDYELDDHIHAADVIVGALIAAGVTFPEELADPTAARRPA